MKTLPHGLIVSCQALPDEPLYSDFIMRKMALAAKQGGARGIRANSVVDIEAIQDEVDLPIIGIIKKDYADSKVYITATMTEVKALIDTHVAVIAMDATSSPRPGGISLDEFFKAVKANYPEQLFMADCSTVDEALHAAEIGFDYVGTTMVGYTDQSRDLKIEDNDFAIIREIIKRTQVPLVAEGHIDTPAKAKRVLELGAHAVVVGGAITRPKQITASFAAAISEIKE